MTTAQIERVERCLITILERVALSKHLSARMVAAAASAASALAEIHRID